MAAPFRDYRPTTLIDTRAKAMRDLDEAASEPELPASLDTEFNRDRSIAVFSYSRRRGERKVVFGEFATSVYADWLVDKRFKKVYSDFKQDAVVFDKLDLDMRPSFYADIVHMDWLVDENSKQHGLKDQVRRHLHRKRLGFRKLFCYVPPGKKKDLPLSADQVYGFAALPDDALATCSAEDWFKLGVEYSGDDCEDTILLFWRHRRYLEKIGYWPNYLRYDRPFTLVVMACEARGVMLDVPRMQAIKAAALVEKARAEHVFRAEVGKPDLNLNAKDQLRAVLIDELEWPVFDDMLTKKGGEPQVTKASLKRYSDEGYDLADVLIRRETKTKLGKDVASFLRGVSPDGRVRTDINQVGTVSGRISSRQRREKILVEKVSRKGVVTLAEKTLTSGSNLANIVAEGEKDVYGVRKCFIAPKKGQRTADGTIAEEDYVIVAVDESGFELVMALEWVSRLTGKVPKLLEVMRKYGSPSAAHAYTAINMLGVPIPMEEWHRIKKEYPDEYRLAKIFNFGLIYGGDEYTITRKREQDTRDRRVLAKNRALVEKFFRLYPELVALQKALIRHARKRGWVPMISGRRRHLAEVINAWNERERKHAENQAVNSTIQGCLPAATRVLTKKGLLPIGEIDDDGLAWTGTSWSPYEKVDRGPCQIARVDLANGASLTCDVRHHFLVQEDGLYRFKSYADLEKGDRVCLSMARKVEFGEPTSTPEEFYWMGFAIGNGCTRHGIERGLNPNMLSITFGDRKGRYDRRNQARRFEAFVRERWGLPLQAPREKSGCVTMRVQNACVRKDWEKLGYPWGKRAVDKHVPTSVWRCSTEERTSFLVGLMDADGTVGDGDESPQPCLHLCQRDILREVAMLFRTCGVECRLRDNADGSFSLHPHGGMLARLGYGPRRRKLVVPGMPAPRGVVSDFLARAQLDARTRFWTSSHATLRSRLARGGDASVYTLCAMYRAAGMRPPPMYATSKVIAKQALERFENTFTLSVTSSLHRFDSEGIVSKNSCADVIKAAMVAIENDEELRARGYRQLTQVYDEIVGECPKSQAAWCLSRVSEHMKAPFRRGRHVEFAVEGKYADSWGEAK